MSCNCKEEYIKMRMTEDSRVNRQLAEDMWKVDNRAHLACAMEECGKAIGKLADKIIKKYIGVNND